ncbi:hypothetical protein FOQG_15428 [Fusarium oxysporum f. sp. raphani 54005]|uniref:Uncharacterized protein n=2 Tax=Fusarium oxysporum f. sp. raphani TaxID=96318 RepID=X0BCW4_FUSOX|nr:hypothetical protein FOQG_15428 [Fusarium oxysporum f. sp. raphani 54005]KAG7438252.1 hypothetical protein Forpi1262_v000028 [Fusarium oxysporum f. sp. raphani]
MSSNQHNIQSYTKLTAKEYQSYTNTRKQIYGQNVNTRLHPTPQAERDYNTYSQWREQSNASRDQYEKSLKEAIGPNGNFQMLQQRQHQDLVLPAAQAATDTNLHASTRNDFLDKHPYAYKNARARKQHEKLADNSVKEAKHYRQAYDTHYEKAGAPAPPIRQAPYGTHGSCTAATPGIPSLQPSLPVPTPRQAENSRIPSPSEAYGQAPYRTQPPSVPSTTATYRQPSPVSASPPQRSQYTSIPTASEAYGRSSSVGTQAAYRQPSSASVAPPRRSQDPRIPSPSEAYGQAYYSTQSSTRTSVSTPHGQQPPVSAPLPPHLYGPRLPSPKQAYGNKSSSRKMDRRQ